MDKAGRFIQGFLLTLIGCLFLAACVSLAIELIKSYAIIMIEDYGSLGILFVITVLVMSIVGGVLVVKQDI